MHPTFNRHQTKLNYGELGKVCVPNSVILNENTKRRKESSKYIKI